MKLERFKDKNEMRKKVILIGLTVVTLITISMVLFKSFANFRQTVSFTIMSGKVKYKPKGKNFTDVVQPTTSGDGLYSVTHSGANGDWSKAELRYAGSNPNNYVYFNCDIGKEEDSTNCELWRIIGKVNVKTNSNTIEQRIKLIRNESLGNYSWDFQDGSLENDWTQASLMGMLNDTYYYSKDDSTYCYTGSGTPSATACRFNSSKPKGLTEKARDMIEKDTLSWNIGGWSGTATADEMYINERGTRVYSGRPTEWKVGTTKDPRSGTIEASLFRGVALMYPSDFGYAVGGGVRSTCLEKTLFTYDQSNCYSNDWLYISGSEQLFLTPFAGDRTYVGLLLNMRYVRPMMGSNAYSVRPVVFLNENVKIGEGSGSNFDPYHLVM